MRRGVRAGESIRLRNPVRVPCSLEAEGEKAGEDDLVTNHYWL